MNKFFYACTLIMLTACAALGIKPNPTTVVEAHFTALNAQDHTAVTKTYLPDQQSGMSTYTAATNLTTQALLVANVFGAETEQLIESIKNSPFSYTGLTYTVEEQVENTAVIKVTGNVTINVYDITVPYCDYVDVQYDEPSAQWYIDGVAPAKKIRFESMIQKKTAKFAELALTVGVSLLGGGSMTDPGTVKLILPYLFDQCTEQSS